MRRFSVSHMQKHSSNGDSKVLVFMEFKHSILLTFFRFKKNTDSLKYFIYYSFSKIRSVGHREFGFKQNYSTCI